MVEIMERLKIIIDWSDDICFAAIHPYINKRSEGKTINEAVCMEAYKYFKQ